MIGFRSGSSPCNEIHGCSAHEFSRLKGFAVRMVGVTVCSATAFLVIDHVWNLLKLGFLVMAAYTAIENNVQIDDLHTCWDPSMMTTGAMERLCKQWFERIRKVPQSSAERPEVDEQAVGRGDHGLYWLCYTGRYAWLELQLPSRQIAHKPHRT